MNSFYTIVAVLAAIALIGSTGASLQQQASAQGVVVEYKTQFTKLTDDMQKAVLAAFATDPPNPDRVQKLLDEYSGKVMALFQNSSKSFEPN